MKKRLKAPAWRLRTDDLTTKSRIAVMDAAADNFRRTSPPGTKVCWQHTYFDVDIGEEHLWPYVILRDREGERLGRYRFVAYLERADD